MSCDCSQTYHRALFVIVKKKDEVKLNESNVINELNGLKVVGNIIYCYITS